MSLITIYPFAMPWECVWWHKTIWQKQWSNSDETVMHQWWDSDGTVMPLIWVIFKDLRRHWSYLILLQCIWSVIMHLLVAQHLLPKTVFKQWWNSDATVMPQQWCDSDTTVMPLIRALFCAFDLGSLMSFSSFWDVIDHILSFWNALGVCQWSFFILLECLGGVISDTRPFDKNSDQTVMRQWSNSYVTVMEQVFLWFELFNTFSKVLRWHWSYFILLQCIWSVIIHLLVTQDHLTIKVIKQWRDSDGTVMQQWCLWFHFQAFEMSMIIIFLLQWFWSVIMHPLVTQDLLTNTVIKQWCYSDVTEMQQWCNSDAFWFRLFYVICTVLRCYWSYFILLQCLGGVFEKQWSNSDQTVMRQWWNSDATVMPLIWAF
jgi:hypothetical protein